MTNVYELSMTDLEAKSVSLQSFFGIGSNKLTPSTNADAAALIKVFKTAINVNRDGNPDQDDFTFKETKFDFKNEAAPQILLIDTSQLQSIDVIDSVSLELAEVGNHVHLDAMAVDNGSQAWPGVRLTEKFDVKINEIIIIFKMPKKTRYFSFFVRLHLKPGGRNLPYFDCDPQVGNDPPVTPRSTPGP